MATYQIVQCWETRPHRPHYDVGNYMCNGVWPDSVPTIEDLEKEGNDDLSSSKC